MIKAVKGDGSRHAFMCEICKGVSGRIFKIRYTTPIMDGKFIRPETETKEVWICHSCAKEFINAMLDARLESAEGEKW